MESRAWAQDWPFPAGFPEAQMLSRMPHKQKTGTCAFAAAAIQRLSIGTTLSPCSIAAAPWTEVDPHVNDDNASPLEAPVVDSPSEWAVAQ